MLTKVANEDILCYFRTHGLALDKTRVAIDPREFSGRTVSKLPAQWVKAAQTQNLDALTELWGGLADGFGNFFQSLIEHYQGLALMEIDGKWTLLYLLEVEGHLEVLFGAPPLDLRCTLHPDWPLLPEDFRMFYYVHTRLRDRYRGFRFWGPQSSWKKLSQLIPEDEWPESWRANGLNPRRCLVVGNDGATTFLCFRLTKSPLTPALPFLWDESEQRVRFVEDLLSEMDRDYSLFPFQVSA